MIWLRIRPWYRTATLRERHRTECFNDRYIYAYIEHPNEGGYMFSYGTVVEFK